MRNTLVIRIGDFNNVASVVKFAQKFNLTFLGVTTRATYFSPSFFNKVLLNQHTQSFLNSQSIVMKTVPNLTFLGYNGLKSLNDKPFFLLKNVLAKLLNK